MKKTQRKQFPDVLKSENARLDEKLGRIADTLNAVLGDHETRIRAIERQTH